MIFAHVDGRFYVCDDQTSTSEAETYGYDVSNINGDSLIEYWDETTGDMIISDWNLERPELLSRFTERSKAVEIIRSLFKEESDEQVTELR